MICVITATVRCGLLETGNLSRGPTSTKPELLSTREGGQERELYVVLKHVAQAEEEEDVTSDVQEARKSEKPVASQSEENSRRPGPRRTEKEGTRGPGQNLQEQVSEQKTQRNDMGVSRGCR